MCVHNQRYNQNIFVHFLFFRIQCFEVSPSHSFINDALIRGLTLQDCCHEFGREVTCMSERTSEFLDLFFENNYNNIFRCVALQQIQS